MGDLSRGQRTTDWPLNRSTIRRPHTLNDPSTQGHLCVTIDEVLDLGEFEAFAEMLHQARDLGVEFAAQAGTAAGPEPAAVVPAVALAAEPEAAAGELVWWAAAVASPRDRWRIVVGGCR
eukprot:COSAG01_NODE_327_length_18766_cov_84.941983_14_plen_120_part_00